MRTPFTHNNREECETFEDGGYQVMLLSKVVPKVVPVPLPDATFLTFAFLPESLFCAKLKKVTKWRFCPIPSF